MFIVEQKKNLGITLDVIYIFRLNVENHILRINLQRTLMYTRDGDISLQYDIGLHKRYNSIKDVSCDEVVVDISDYGEGNSKTNGFRIQLE